MSLSEKPLEKTTARLTALFADRTQRMKASEIRELLKLLDQPDIISFAGGIPDPAYFPREAFAEAMNKALSEQAASVALQYSTSEGYTPLRDWIVCYMARHGVTCTRDNILITAGSQQALDYLGKIFLDQGDTALVTWPTYMGALGAFNAYEPRYDRIDPQTNRPVEDVLADAKAAGGAVKFAYLSTDFANPTGVTLTEEQRRTVLARADALGCAVIEDAAYQELRYRGEEIKPILALEIEEKGDIDACRTIYLGSFSKTLAPGLRVGWAVAAKPVISQLVLTKQAADLQTATINQIAVSEVAHGVFDAHVAKLREVYGARLQAMLAALERHMPEGIAWTKPDGGMFVWVTLPRDMDGAELLKEALKANVAFVPGGAFYADGSNTNTLRLNFSMSAASKIEEGIARLGQVIRNQM
ncbi:PLP-dependent aminotransferase family protein [Celeribacter halophilus]|uniref:aminotransferase-like domain-containing protein n=1 Tax=Celeribacter halophilus TaxID=576117 RepID=UPI002091630B|nr:PLP-dependent aminotransferase family protein [Celeribacter halophilus]MDO6510488.1 PLP-dependent aminotransferase family protein [Celeribacter halophilus]